MLKLLVDWNLTRLKRVRTWRKTNKLKWQLDTKTRLKLNLKQAAKNNIGECWSGCISSLGYDGVSLRAQVPQLPHVHLAAPRAVLLPGRRFQRWAGERRSPGLLRDLHLVHADGKAAGGEPLVSGKAVRCGQMCAMGGTLLCAMY